MKGSKEVIPVETKLPISRSAVSKKLGLETCSKSTSNFLINTIWVILSPTLKV